MTSVQIKLLRKRLKLSQTSLALRLGVWRETVATWEAGAHKPSFHLTNELRRMAGLRDLERGDWMKIKYAEKA